MDAGELEVDQSGVAGLTDDDVLLLVQVVVADAVGVELGDERVQAVEEVAREPARQVQGCNSPFEC